MATETATREISYIQAFNEALAEEMRLDSSVIVMGEDVAGAGDSLFITASLSLSRGANIWEASYLGSLAAAIQVGRVGNVPIEIKEILSELS